MFFLNSDLPSQLSLLDQLLTDARKQQLSTYVVCSNHLIQQKLYQFLAEKYPQSTPQGDDSNSNNLLPNHHMRSFVIHHFNFIKLLRFISIHDINIIHLLPSHYLWYWNYFIRQLAALRIYCPPVIVQQTSADDIDSSLLVNTYMQKFG